MIEPFDNEAIAPGTPPPPLANPDLLPPPEPRRRWTWVALTMGILAWCVIIVVATAIAAGERNSEEKLGETAGKESINLLTMRAQARYLLGARDTLSQFSPGSEHQIAAQVNTLNVGPLDQRLRYVVLVGELQGPDAAVKALDDLDALIARNNAKLTQEQESQRTVLRKLYADYRRLRYDAPSVSDADRKILREQLGWFGKLALAPEGQPAVRDEVIAAAGGAAAIDIYAECPDPAGRDEALRPAKRVTVTIWTAVGGGVFFLFLGFCGLLLLVVLMVMGKLRGGLVCGWSPAGVYAETFALWMLMFVALSIGVSRLEMGEFRYIAAALVMLFSLVVVFWPVLRGLSWRQVREDIGWTLGRRPALEPGIGVGCYVMSYPLLVVGIVMVLGLMAAQTLLSGGGPSADDLTSPSTPGHPVVGPLASGDWPLRLQLFFLASIVAPIVEETMFRGVLYRHLREVTRRFALVGSMIVAGLVSSFIFAVIHPQGLLGIPVLMALAIAFVLTREWRGTLIPCMVAHGLNNGLVLLVSVGMLAE
ncbi:MAG TPA: type II CAAX endopeptidase family protein [Gemmataceae bacterium]|nr:type II CAAX endopeptidase family protein [Gemmataceae bacterium]